MAARPRERKQAVNQRTARGQAATRTALAPGVIPTVFGLCATGLVGMIYLTIASGGTFHFRQSPYPHHVLVADAWLHGQLNVRDEVIAERNAAFYARYRAEAERQLAAKGQQLSDELWQQLRTRIRSPAEHDWSIVGGKHYGYWPPMASFCLLPYVAFAGLQASDMLFSCLVGSGTVFLIFLMIRQAARVGLVPVDTRTCTALTLLFGLGTVHFYLAVTGQVWFLSQVVATFFMTMAVWLVLQTEAGWGSPAAAGAAFGAAFLARNGVLVMAPFFYLTLFALSHRQPGHSWRPVIPAFVAFSIPLIVAGAINAEFNYLRFGSIFETSQELVVGGDPRFKDDYLHYGMFSLRYVPRNVYYYLLNPSLRRHPVSHAITFDPWGNSTFLVTPALLYIFRSGRRLSLFTVALWVGAGALLAVLLLFVATGFYQFGNRYILELLPLAMLLIAIGMSGRLTRVGILLIALSVAANAWGMYRFAAEQF